MLCKLLGAGHYIKQTPNGNLIGVVGNFGSVTSVGIKIIGGTRQWLAFLVASKAIPEV